VNYASLSKSEVINNGLADCLQEMQWVVDNIALDLRVHAEILERLKRPRVLATFLNSNVDLLNQAWPQLRLNLTLMSHQ
jgi:hypothetical protein